MATVKPKPDQDLTHLAYERNVARDAIASHPHNTELLLSRDAEVLHAEDEVVVPPATSKWVSVRTGASHTFVYAPLQRPLRLRITDAA